jgi:hypothetical protein
MNPNADTFNEWDCWVSVYLNPTYRSNFSFLLNFGSLEIGTSRSPIDDKISPGYNSVGDIKKTIKNRTI